MDIFRLDGKVAVIFGGNGVLGKQFCKSLLEYGAFVYSCDVNVSESAEVRELLTRFSDKFRIVRIDATKKDALDTLKSSIIRENHRLDILINSTTMKSNDFYLPFENVSLEGWNTGLLGNLTIPFLTIQTFIPIMKQQRSGSIINIASVYGLVGNDQRIYIGANFDKVYVDSAPIAGQIHSHGVYNAAKGGLINFTRYLAAYYGEFNIRINCISPGGLFSPKDNAESTRKYSERVPLGRKANPDEANGAVLFLASDASTYVTGHNLVVDGGYTIW
jgi:NAD(P)-dependent dehydrogenase (short-subunit alcohol dehydrogenase family)